MAKDFDEILTSMLEQLENNPDQDVDVLVKGECEKMGVSEEGKVLLSETNEYIDVFAEKMAASEMAETISAFSFSSRSSNIRSISSSIHCLRDFPSSLAFCNAGENVNNETLKDEED